MLLINGVLMDHIYYFVQSNLLSFQIHSFPALSAILPHSIHFNFYNLYSSVFSFA